MVSWVLTGFYIVLILTIISMMTFILKRRGNLWIAVNVIVQGIAFYLYYTAYSTSYEHLEQLADSVFYQVPGFYVAAISSLVIIVASVAYSYLPVRELIMDDGAMEN